MPYTAFNQTCFSIRGWRLPCPTRCCLSFFVCLFLWLICGNRCLADDDRVPDEATLKAAGIRTLTSEHLTLYTDLPSSPEVDQLPKVFELAIPLWAKYFEVGQNTFEGWKVTAHIIRNKERFREYKLLPANLPPFLHGFQKFDSVWVYEQPSPYYRRHLLLHEGTHAAMNRVFGHVGPAWYREGVAELLGTHRYQDGKLTMPYFPANRKEVEHWGRIKIVKDEIAKGNVRSIMQIVDANVRDYLTVESYAWSWALQSFGYSHPKFKKTFASLQTEMYFSEHGVTNKFVLEYEKQKHELDTAWYLFLAHLDYGYDSSRELVHRSERIEEATPGKIFQRKVDSAKGWQSTGLKLPAGAKLDIAASGRFQITLEPATVDQPAVPWMCEPQGVTIEYYQGRPLGQLIATIAKGPADSDAFTRPQSIGYRKRIDTDEGGTLYLRANERSDQLNDNRGQMTVKLRVTAGAPSK